MSPPSAVSGRLQLRWRPFRLELEQPLLTAAGRLGEKRGWLLRLEAAGRIGWGEAAPLAPDPDRLPSALRSIAAAIEALGATAERVELERRLPALPGPLAFAIGAALAECDGLVGPAAGGWQPAPAGAVLLPAGEAAVAALERALAAAPPAGALPFTLKWKVAAAADALERRVLEGLLERLPPGSRLRLDANGGWDRSTARAWGQRLAGEPRLAWLEQPLPPADRHGLEALAAGPPPLPVALDESLRADPALRRHWQGWQVRRPALEGDPRPLLARLRRGVPRLMLSTAFETGIARRWLHQLAALQACGPTPAAPGLAPGWLAEGPLLDPDPETVWQSATLPSAHL